MSKAQQAFQDTLREAAARAARGAPDGTRLWLFREARRRSLAATEADLQAESVSTEEHELSDDAPAQLAKLEPAQLATWIAGAPEPQRSALALFYLGEFTPSQITALLGITLSELAEFIARGRRQFQAWANNTLS